MPPVTFTPPVASPDVSEHIPIRELRAKWGWFVALGAALLIVGVIALLNTLLATVASIYTIAAMMLVAGVMQVFHSVGVRTWSSFFLWLLAGLVYVLGAVAALFNPLLASAVLTLVLAGFLVAGGAIRIMAGLQAKSDRNWGWIIFSGALTLVAGLVIAVGWPTSSLWVLGTFLAVDLIFQGWAMLAFGLALRR
jgi:uncharacterized membrane protein HdeD (DUF308 family)